MTAGRAHGSPREAGPPDCEK
eukprot:COSAG03_NODE_8834_length_767_cov_0.552395_1_plen_20_part_10